MGDVGRWLEARRQRYVITSSGAVGKERLGAPVCISWRWHQKRKEQSFSSRVRKTCDGMQMLSCCL